MKNFYAFIFIFSLCINDTYSQVAHFNLSINNINATVLNNGDLFDPSYRGDETFEVPKGSTKKTIFAAGLWIGALDSLQKLHLTSSMYQNGGEGEFLPGPVSDNIYQGKSNIYNNIFYLTQTEIDFHKQHFSDKNYSASKNILTWPGNGNVNYGEALRLAPFVDVNNNNLYEPLLGDYPLIPGDACAFSIYNDKNGYDENLNVEVHQFVYEYNDPSSVLNNALFVTYKIFNRSKFNYHNAYFGQFVDYDLGNYSDDAVCSDSLRNLMIAYNADDTDEGVNGYGLNPPAMGCLFLNHKMSRNIAFNNDFTFYGNPQKPGDYYTYMQGFYKNMQPIKSLDCGLKIGAGGDIRSLGVSDSFGFPSNTSTCFTVAHIFAKASSGGAQGSVVLLKESSDFIQKYFNNKWIDDACDAYAIANGWTSRSKKNFQTNIFPNPVKNELKVGFDYLNSKNANFVIFNTLGQVVMNGLITGEETILNTTDLTTGVYFIKIGNETRKFVKN